MSQETEEPTMREELEDEDSDVLTLSVEEFHSVLQEQDVDDRKDLEFVCPQCGTVQSAQDLIDAGAGDSYEDVSGSVAFSCVGRWDEEKGCDWTLGGLLQIHELVVVDEEGNEHPRFLPVNMKE